VGSELDQARKAKLRAHWRAIFMKYLMRAEPCEHHRRVRHRVKRSASRAQRRVDRAVIQESAELD
jgi:hypothetical protein